VDDGFTMGNATTRKPTAAELEILQVLWRLGPCTVRQVQEELGEETGYTTVLKFMQIMTEKGLVKRDTADRSHVYSPAVAEDLTKRGLVRDLLDKAFQGSAKALVLQALSARRTSREELAEIREIIERLEKGSK
jgi:BlaI family transcriptional regulator, penicillinase repressor